MQKNMGELDRTLRSAVAMGIGAFILSGQVKGTTAIALGGLATVFLLTSSVGHCPAYAVAGINSLPEPA